MESDFVVIGSGAAGATVALTLASAGREVLILEEGSWHRTPSFQVDMDSAIKKLFRNFGMQAAHGRSTFPVLEGRAVGGSTVINGAIVHRLPKSVYENWARDPAFARRISYQDLEVEFDFLERSLQIKRNVESDLASASIMPVIQKLGWHAHAMQRNAPFCQSSGRCLQGCPTGGKWSMENSFIPLALERGARLIADARVLKIEGQEILAQTAKGLIRVRARHAIVVAAGAVQTPLLLRRSGFRHEQIGENFQVHLGVGVSGLHQQSAFSVQGPPQGIEILEFEERGLKLATQLLPPELILARTPLVGEPLKQALLQAENVLAWTASVQSEARGRVHGSLCGKARIHFTPTVRDMENLRFGVQQLAELLFAAGAHCVYPSIHGIPSTLTRRDQCAEIANASLDPRSYFLGVGHIFGTCRMGGDDKAPVNVDFRLRGHKNIFVVDASVFPSNIGVNPQLSIMAMARMATRHLLSA